MRYPLGKDTQDFKKNWYIASNFGEDRGSYRHNGVDLNLRTGADSDLGQPIYAISKGKLEYFHKNSHPTTNYGYHNVYRIDGAWGTRWIHSGHQLDDLLTGVQDLTESQQTGRVGKSGTNYAHCHFSIFKVDPSTLRNGIDTIAKTKAELDAWWEDPMLFIERWIDVSTEKTVTITQKELDEIRLLRDTRYNFITAICDVFKVTYQENLDKLLENFKSVWAGHQSTVTTLQKEKEELEGKVGVLKEKVKIAEDALAVKQTEYQSRESTLIAQIDELNKARPDLEKLEKIHRGSMDVAEGELIKAKTQREKDRITIAKLEALFKNLTFIQKFRLLFG